jgi:hypothetical protein
MKDICALHLEEGGNTFLSDVGNYLKAIQHHSLEDLN